MEKTDLFDCPKRRLDAETTIQDHDQSICQCQFCMLSFLTSQLMANIRNAQNFGPWIGLAAASLIILTVAVADAQQLTSGTGSRQFRTQAIEAVPLKMLNRETQQKLQPILDKPSLYRRLPVTAIQCDEDYFRYLVRHPEVIVEIWKLMGVTKMEAQRTGPFSIRTNDGAGTLSDLELVYGDGQKHIFYAKGTYEGPLLGKKLSGRCVMVLQSSHDTDKTGFPRVTSQLDVFIRIDNVAAGVLARTIQPMVGPSADHNFTESLRFLQRLNDTTLQNGTGVQMMGQRLELQPDVLAGFQQVAGLTYQRGLQLKGAAGEQRVSRNLSAPAAESRSEFNYQQFGR